MPKQHNIITPIHGEPSLFELLTNSEQQEVIEFVLLIAKRKYQHLDKNHIPRLVNAMQMNSTKHIRAELQYANETLGASYDLSKWEVQS